MKKENEINLFDDDPIVVKDVEEVKKSNPLKDLVSTKGNASLNDLIRLYQEIEEKLIESGGVADFGDQMAAVEEKIETKLDNCKGLIDYWKGQVSYLDERAKVFSARKTGIKNGIEWLRCTMKSALLLTGKEKVKTIEGTYFFSAPKTPVKIDMEKMTGKYEAALQKINLRTHNVVITIPSTIPDFRKTVEAYLKKPIKGSKMSITEPEYDIKGIAERWMKGNRKWPAWLAPTEKTFTIR